LIWVCHNSLAASFVTKQFIFYKSGLLRNYEGVCLTNK
jgi:hypothetical protein